MRIKKLPGALVIAALVTLAISLEVATPNVYGDGEGSQPTLPEKPELKYPNLGSNLDQLVASIKKGKTSAKEAAEDAPARREASVAVTIYLSGNVDEVVKFLQDNDGSPRNVGEDYIEAYVPVSLLGRVSEQPGVIRVREIIPPAATQPAPPPPPQPAPPQPPQPPQIPQQVDGHGPPVHGSSAWNQAGFSGQGIKVGVIDLPFGFNGFSRLMGTELPSTVQARCYTSLGKFTQSLADCENYMLGNNHGTVVAEAVLDIAPEVSLYIAAPRSPGDLQTATDWMVSQGVSVIVHSVTHEYDGPGDGTSPFSDSPLRAVDRAVAGGSVWVNSAGNAGLRTWFGAYSNSDGDSYIDFNGFDEGIDIQLKAGDEITVQLRWEDSWSGATSDFDLYVYDHPTKVIVASSFDPQGGAAGHVPYESVNYIASHDGPYFVSVLHYSGSTPRWIQLKVWDVDLIEYYTESGGIANPAESRNPGMLAVGAAHWNSVGSIEPYSSRGPTPDGRVKPDIVGADCGATALRPLDEYGDGFCGTSQAAPHVAGMAALVRQRFPDYTPAQVAAYLKNHAQQRETPDPNNTWGHGFAQLPSPDREALEALYNATSGANWLETTNWMTSSTLSTWHGVTTDNEGRVTELNLTRNQLKGEIPPELADLTNLKVLALGGNELTGKIPAGLGSLANLEELYLWGNELTGTMPAELGSLANLVQLQVSENQLTGEIPVVLGSLANLKELWLSENQLTGEIPVELGNLSNLAELVLWGNKLTGAIPTELGSLSNLELLSLSANQLTGEIPAELGSLTNLTGLYLYGNQLTGEIPAGLGSLANLEELYLWGNELTGTMPAELGSLANLVQLQVSENQLTGEIPVVLGSLANLKELWLSENQLTGEIPVELGNLSNLAELVLWGNKLTGAIPTELGSLSNLELLSLSANQLTGEIPAELGSLTNLTGLYLYGNQLTGEIPPELGSLANLTILSLADNELTGRIPTELGSLANLEELYLWGNELTGTMPAELGSLANLVQLQVSENQLTGEIPVELGNLSNLAELVLWGNKLTGAIPTELGSLSNLELLSLSANQLTGEIPAELGSLTNLQELDLGANQLTEEIPPELGNLTNLGLLNLSDNQLSGEIPPELGSLSNLTSLDLDGNQLSGEIPPELGSLSNLELLFLGGNPSLSGPLPGSFTSLISLTYLSLSGTGLCAPTDDTFQAWLGGIAERFGVVNCPELTDRDALIARYDTDDNKMIDKDEVINAINDYLFGEGDEAISKAEVIELINLYLFG